MKTQDRKGISLRTKIVSGLAAIFLVTLVSIGVAAGIGHWTLTAFDTVLEENASCYTVQDALKAETRAFERYVRESSQENAQELAAACDAAEASLEALPFDYAELGEERYARTWNLLQGYAGYRQSRDAFLQQTAETDGYVEEMYRIMDMQDYLSEYALRLTQATLEQESADYQEHAQMMQRLPGLYGGMLAAAVVLMALILKMLTSTVVVPLLQLVQASRSIAENDFSGEDLPVKTTDEVGQLTGTFNQMKHAMADYVAALNALHREEMRNLALEKDLEHTRLEVLKSQVNPHFLFNTLNMISCMARLEDAAATDEMIVRLGSMFRHNLRTKAQEITLEEELEGVEDYIYLQQMRFDGRITVEKKIDADPAAVRLPSFTLQPVIENAFAHGLKSCEEGGRILVRAWQEQNRLILTVADNGKGMDAQELAALQEKIRQSEQTGKGIGLGNISRRISMLYQNGGMHIYSRPGHGTVVRFEIPQAQKEDAS